MNRIALYALLVWSFMATHRAAGAPPDDAKTPDDLPRQMNEAGDLLRQLGDWEYEAELGRYYFDQVWAENHWTSTADRFARDTGKAIIEIPAWNLKGRLDKFEELIQERYRFSDDQQREMGRAIQREVIGLVVRNAATIFQQTRESVGMRLRGEPFTAEQVAEWTRQSEPLLADVRSALQRVVERMEPQMDPEQRKLLAEDLKSYAQRKSYYDRLRADWIEGKWKAEDWGLQNDAIQRGKTDPRVAPRTEPILPSAEQDTSPLAILPHDETTWPRYASVFVDRYGLDPGQRRAVQSILTELVSDATEYRRTHKDELDAVPWVERSLHPKFAPIRALFEILERRLATIPTAAQRAAADTEKTAPASR